MLWVDALPASIQRLSLVVCRNKKPHRKNIDPRQFKVGKGWEGGLSALTLTEMNEAPAVRAKGNAVVRLDGFEFTNGVIEFVGDLDGSGIFPWQQPHESE